MSEWYSRHTKKDLAARIEQLEADMPPTDEECLRNSLLTRVQFLPNVISSTAPMRREGDRQMNNPKTITVATKGDSRRVITKSASGWRLPPEEGHGAYIGGTGAYAECCARWREAGWHVAREQNPHYRPRTRLFSFA